MITQKDRNTIFDNIHKLTIYDIKDLFTNVAYVSQSITVFLTDKLLAGTKDVKITDIIDYPQVIETYVLHIEKLAKTIDSIDPKIFYEFVHIPMKAYASGIRYARNKLGLEKFTEVICGFIPPRTVNLKD